MAKIGINGFGRIGRLLLRPCGSRSLLSEAYKVQGKWNERLNTDHLRGIEPNKYFSDLLMRLNSGTSIFATDVDTFVNVARPNEHLEETIYLLRQIRRSSRAATVLPSTHHAVCRLLLDSNRLNVLAGMLESRVAFGLFPDKQTINLILDRCIDDGQYNLGTRVAATIMIQEEFGLNPITDRLSFYSLIKYLEEDKDFEQWAPTTGKEGIEKILSGSSGQSDLRQVDTESERTTQKNENDDDDEDEEEVEYVRIPFLRNEYFDDHFDLKEPRQIYGKSLGLLGRHLQDVVISKNAQLLGSVILGSWDKTNVQLDSMLEDSSIKFAKDVLDKCKYYIENVHSLPTPSNDHKERILGKIEKVGSSQVCNLSLSDMANDLVRPLPQLEQKDIEQLVKWMDEWNKMRSDVMKRQMANIMKLKRIQEIKQKRKEIKEKEQFLYYYENLRKSKINRISYD